MNLVVIKRATVAIAKTGNWIEQHNTEGSGERWINKVYHALETEARLGIKHAICHDENFARSGVKLESFRNIKLAKRKYHCFAYNEKWVVAYQIKGDDFIINRFIYGANLV